jgi:hypothetical protein
MKELTPKESQVLWWDAEEYDDMIDQCELTIAKMENGELVKDKDKNYSAVGLESWTKEGFQRRQRHQEEAIDVVLEEQFAQWGDGVDDEETIAEFYGARSSHCKMVAMTKGLAMEREVQEYLMLTMEDYDSVSTRSTRSARSLLSSSSLLSMRSGSSEVSTKSTKSSKSNKSSKLSKSTKSKSSDASTSRSPAKTKNKLGRAPKSPTKKWRQKSNDDAARDCCRSV